jgi:hypothetical protein
MFPDQKSDEHVSRTYGFGKRRSETMGENRADMGDAERKARIIRESACGRAGREKTRFGAALSDARRLHHAPGGCGKSGGNRSLQDMGTKNRWLTAGSGIIASDFLAERNQRKR